jgi:glycosyltransferase involved in cell wall biosynthesis
MNSGETMPGITPANYNALDRSRPVVNEGNLASRRVRVLLIGTHLPHTAGSRSVAEGIAEGLQQRGFDLRVTSRLRSRFLRVTDLLVTTWASRHRYDLAHVDVYSGAAFRWAEWAVGLIRMAGKPVVLTLRGGNLPAFARRHPRRMSRLLSAAAAVTAPSAYLAEAVRTTRDDVRIIPNPIAIEAYTYSERNKPRATLVWLRAFHRIYDPTLAVKVLARVAEYDKDAHLTMIGPDKDGSLADVRAEAKRLGVLDRIDFAGGVPKSEVPGLLAAADIFLNTTTIDNTPVSLIEAMATGLVVISTAVGGIPYLVENERDGLLVPVGDCDAMANAIRRALYDPGLAPRLSRGARSKAQNFGWDSILPRWEALFHEIARNASSGNARISS